MTTTGGPGGDTALLARARAAAVAVRGGYAEQLAVVAELEAQGVAVAQGYRSTARLLEDLWRVNAGEAKRLVHHAEALTPGGSLSGERLPPALPNTAAALNRGRIDGEHVRVIDAAMSRVQDVPGLSPDDVDAAEALLADAADGLAPAGLAQVADRLIRTLDPDGAAPVEPESPRDELMMVRRRKDGAVKLDALLHGVEGESAFEVLDALSSPAGPDDDRSLSQRRAAALCELVAQALSPTGIAARTPCCDNHTDEHANQHTAEHAGDPTEGDTADYSTAADPHTAGDGSAGGEDERAEAGRAGGEHADSRHADSGHADDGQAAFPDALRGAEPSPTTPSRAPSTAGPGCATCATVAMRGRALLTVTMDYHDLANGIGHGLLDSGLAVTPRTARRLACDAGIVPIVLGSRSEPLDVGRLTYSTPEGMRRALHQRDRGCSFPGCTRRPRRCHAHHVQSWLDGGDTALHNMTLLCSFHHHLIHHGGWTVEMINGRPWYTPPAWIDPTRTPRPGGVDTHLAG